MQKDYKACVFGMVQRNRDVKAFHVANSKYYTLGQLAIDNSATIITDEFKAYTMLKKYFASHKTINHSAGQYVVNNAHTNTIECFCSQLKRGIYGVYHNISKKYLQNYINEFTFR